MGLENCMKEEKERQRNASNDSQMHQTHVDYPAPLHAGRARDWLLCPSVLVGAPALVTAFLFQHAMQGWCPPVPILRRLGFRTADEIGKERMALKAVRGDFDRLPQSQSRASAAMQAVEA
jgi:hypothetical protein